MIREQENSLFEQWKEYVADAVFVKDGVVNEEQWNSAPIKVLYLLKEVNGGDREWDERDYLEKYNIEPNYIKTHSPTISVLTQWQYGIFKGNKRRWDDVEKEALLPEIQSKLLSQICLVNLKKTAGGSVVDWNKFDAYFSKEINRENLRKQLKLYSPDIVICGGTAWHLSQIKGWNDSVWKQTNKGIKYYIEENVVYIDFCHPNIRGPKNIFYYALVDALEEIMTMRL